LMIISTVEAVSASAVLLEVKPSFLAPQSTAPFVAFPRAKTIHPAVAFASI
jgi:hypothetical protein